MAVLLPSTGWSQTDEAFDELLKANKYASRGSISRSIKHYEKVLDLAPRAYPQAYFNLAEVYRAKGECRKAVLLYSIYGNLSTEAKEQQEASKAQGACSRKLVTLSLKTDPATVTARVDGYVWSEQSSPQAIQVMPGNYTVKVEATDHLAETIEIEAAAEPAEGTVKLKKQTFFGTISVDDPGIKGAKVRIFDGPSDSAKVLFEGPFPMKEPVKAIEGKHFVEVTAPDYERWIRNVVVGRDAAAEVKPQLTRMKPAELR